MSDVIPTLRYKENPVFYLKYSLYRERINVMMLMLFLKNTRNTKEVNWQKPQIKTCSVSCNNQELVLIPFYICHFFVNSDSHFIVLLLQKYVSFDNKLHHRNTISKTLQNKGYIIAIHDIQNWSFIWIIHRKTRFIFLDKSYFCQMAEFIFFYHDYTYIVTAG